MDPSVQEVDVRRITLPIIIALLLVAVTFGLMKVARGQSQGGTTVLNQETQGDNRREITGPDQGSSPQQPNIGFIDSPTSTCYQPDSSQDMCYINWYYMSVDASPNYMIAMTVTLNSIGVVANSTGFFQTSMYVPYNMLGNGFRVACGPKGAGGQPNLGNAYAWTLRARDSANLGSANYGTAYCPAYVP
jgi:hypothetical protein